MASMAVSPYAPTAVTLTDAARALVAPSAQDALMLACMTGDVEGAVAALAEGARASLGNEHGISPLLVVCGGVGPAPLLRALLAAPGTDVDARDAAGWTPLIYVASSGLVPLIEELLAAGAAVDARAADRGWTPLTRAAYRGHAAAVARLLAAGADAGARADGRSAADWAAEGGHSDVLAALEGVGSTTR